VERTVSRRLKQPVLGRVKAIVQTMIVRRWNGIAHADSSAR